MKGRVNGQVGSLGIARGWDGGRGAALLNENKVFGVFHYE